MSAPTYLSLFAGVGGFDLGLDAAGWCCAAQVEIDPQARSVLRHRWPHVPKYEDVRHVGRSNLPRVDLICGGFPCQDLSVAGRRAGLAGERSGLFYEFARIIDELAPAWVLLENVPGLLSSNGGRDMAAVVGTLGELGYGWAYRVLDLQHFRIPQRRRRVFIVARAGGVCPPEILLEPESVRGDPAARGEAGEGAAGGAQGGAGGACALNWEHGLAPNGTMALKASVDALASTESKGKTLIIDEQNAAAVDTVGSLSTGMAHGNRGFSVVGAWKPSHYTRGKDGALSPVVPPLSADADKGDQDPLVLAPAGNAVPLLEVGKRTGKSTSDPRAGTGIGEAGDPMYTLQGGAQHGIVPFDTTQITSAANYSRPRTSGRLPSEAGSDFGSRAKDFARDDLRWHGGDVCGHPPPPHPARMRAVDELARRAHALRGDGRGRAGGTRGRAALPHVRERSRERGRGVDRAAHLGCTPHHRTAGGRVSPDISKCAGAGCERRDRCYRYTAPASPGRQSWFAPMRADGTCEHFWPVEPEPEASA
jgi:DNA-cytosine methyltransferase